MTKITSTFNHDADGWTIAGDVAEFEWQRTGGDKGGHLFWQDAASGDDSYWQAPGKFLGDLGDFAGGRLSFAWYASADNYKTSDVLITGANGVTLAGDVADPGTDWTDAAIALSPAGHWHIGTIDGDLATKRQIAAVLADVTGIQIRAEHVSGGETGGLDSVKLVTRPSPTHPADAFGEDRHPHLDATGVAHHAPDASHLMLA